MILSDHVDDLMVAGSVSDMVALLDISTRLSRRFFWGSLYSMAGVLLSGTRKRGMIIHQKSFISKIIERFDVSTESDTSAPTSSDLRPVDELEEGSKEPNRQLIGGY